MSVQFPVLEERSLGRAESRLFRPAKRRLSDLPARPPGSVYVFQVGQRYKLYQDGAHLRGTEGDLVDAMSVSVVQTRPLEIAADLAIPSASAADDFTVRSWFWCEVTSPTTVAERGLRDVPAQLVNFLRRDVGMQKLGTSVSINDINEMRVRADARVRAFCEVRQLEIPGMSVQLTSVEVLTPDTLRSHHTKMRDTVWAAEISGALSQHEDSEIQRLAAYLGQPEYAAALATVRDKMNLAQIVEGAYADRRTRDANILELLKLLEKNGQLDRIPVDGRRLVDALSNRVAGIETLTLAEGVDTSGADKVAAAGPAIDAKEARFVPDEDRLAE
ncbi:hypothetical protein [Catellatospora vulcania]|uniref:hypothetical protein n=1 Tax=Catellatospora vulcania TaxID=1460450 RepID=UPI0012D3F69C|nr:hypothetical protein [Catellatospora vulcania]